MALRRVALLGSPEKAAAQETMERTRRWLAERAQVVFSERTYDSGRALASRPDLLITFGGDGTLIAAVHNLGRNQIPIVGVNLGKLGYLAEFTIEQLEQEGDFLFQGELPITRRVLIDAVLRQGGTERCRTLAVNDCAVFAGPPFRMIELIVEADGDEVGHIRGDGLIIATASGSTAHNLSAGGPILEPTAEAFILTPICPHALTFRPLALDARRRIDVRVVRANEGTTVSIDGHQRNRLSVGDRLSISRYAADFLLVRNPGQSVWSALRRKLMWGEHPRNRK
jgi:NAD+ kinase